MNRFVKRHYHLISFILLAVIFVAWGLLQNQLYPNSASNASETSDTDMSTPDSSDEFISEKADSNAVTETQNSSGTSDVSPDDYASQNDSTDVPSNSSSADNVTTDKLSTAENEEPGTDYDTLPEEIDDAIPDDIDEEPEPLKEVVLEEGTYGPGEGKMPFDLCLANVNESLNVRSGPGEEYEIIAKFLPVDYARVIETYSEWTLISSGEITGYAHNDYLITGEKALKKLVNSDKLCVTVTQKLINVRAEKSTDAEILRQAEKGESFICIPSESDSDWFAIKYDDGNTAYVATTLAHVTAAMDTIDSLTPVG